MLSFQRGYSKVNNSLNNSLKALNTRSISLFSGGMGLDIGLMNAGVDIVIGQDFDAPCVKTIEMNGHKALLGDIREISPETMLELSGMKKGEPFLVCGGPPCQPFSTAGKRGGINDPRGSLFMDFLRMVNGIQPRFFVMENVKGLRSTPLKDEDGNDTDTMVLDIILEEMKKLGYKVVYGLLDAVHYGVPEFRERMIFIGSRDHEDIFLPVPSHFQRHQNPEYRWKTTGAVIKDLEDEPGECGAFSEERLKYLRMVPEGGNWKNLPPEVQEAAMGGAFHSGGGKVGFYRRLSYSQPSPTLVTSPVQKATMLCHPTKDRPLSVREYARIQQFPDDWKFIGTASDKYKQIGNAVPCGLAEAVGKAVIATATGTASVETKRTRGTSVHDSMLMNIGKEI